MEVKCVDCAEIFVVSEDDKWKKICFACWKRKKQQRVDFVDEFSSRQRALLQLCHPDKHAGSALAHQITQWLLAVGR